MEFLVSIIPNLTFLFERGEVKMPESRAWHHHSRLSVGLTAHATRG